MPFVFFFKAYIDSPNILLPTSYIIFAAGLSSVVIGIWRLYVRYLDHQIAMLYPQLMRYELGLNSIPNEGTTCYLLSQLEDKIPDLSKLSSEEKISIVKVLVDRKRVGKRGHKWIDIGVLIVLIIFIILLVLNIINLCLIHSDIPVLSKLIDGWAKFKITETVKNLPQIVKLLQDPSFPIFLLNVVGSLLIWVGLIFYSIACLKYQKEPDKKTVYNILSENNTSYRIARILALLEKPKSS